MSKINLDEPELNAVVFAVRNVMYEKAFGTEEQHALYRTALIKLEAQLHQFDQQDYEKPYCSDFKRGAEYALRDCNGTGYYLCRVCSHFDAEMDTRSGPAVIEKEHSIELALVSEAEWNAKKAREPENSTHPCNAWRHEECDCRGACSCHWKQY